MKLIEAKNDQAMITATGLSCEAFNTLHDKFKEIFDNNIPSGVRNLSGACSHVDKDNRSQILLQLIFGLTQIL